MTIYTLFHNAQTCRSCGRTETWSNLCVTEPYGTGTRYTTVRESPPDDVPIATMQVAGKSIPMCASCIPADAAFRGAEALARFEATRQRKRAEAAHPATPTAPKAPRHTSLEDLA